MTKKGLSGQATQPLNSFWETRYQSSIILNHFEGLKLTLAALKTSYLEQLHSKVFVLPTWMLVPQR
jgi:hypothetical protein